MATSMGGIFKDLTTNRTDRAAASKNYIVVSLKKDGTPRKVTPQMLIDINATITLEDANTRQVEMTRLNPTSTFVVITL